MKSIWEFYQSVIIIGEEIALFVDMDSVLPTINQINLDTLHSSQLENQGIIQDTPWSSDQDRNLCEGLSIGRGTHTSERKSRDKELQEGVLRLLKITQQYNKCYFFMSWKTHWFKVERIQQTIKTFQEKNGDNLYPNFELIIGKQLLWSKIGRVMWLSNQLFIFTIERWYLNKSMFEEFKNMSPSKSIYNYRPEMILKIIQGIDKNTQFLKEVDLLRKKTLEQNIKILIGGIIPIKKPSTDPLLGNNASTGAKEKHKEDSKQISSLACSNSSSDCSSQRQKNQPILFLSRSAKNDKEKAK